MMKEFKEFAMRGNVMDLAVGLILGAAFGKIVNSLVNDVIMPPIGMLLGRVDFSAIVLPLSGGDKPVLLKVGVFANTIIEFVIIAFAVFLIVKQMNRLKRPEQPAAPAPTTKDCPHCATAIPLKATRCPHCTSELLAVAH